jgi:hypothetical protein
MKRTRPFVHCLLLALLLGLFSVSTAQAQSATMAYQGYLTDTEGNPLGGTGNLSFALYATPSGGASLWEETQTNVQVNEGIFSVMLGSEEPFNGVDFENPLYLGIAIDGGSELQPRVPLGAAPASLFAHQIPDGLAVRSLNGLTDDVTLQAGANVTLTEADGKITIDAEAAEAFTLPFEGTNETTTPAFKITSSSASAIVVASEGAAPGISASNNSSGSAAAFSQLNTTSEASAIEAFSFSSGSTGLFSHFGPEGYAGVFRSTAPQNGYPALVAGKQDLDINSDDFFNDALIVRGDAPVLGIYSKFEANTHPGIVLAGVEEDGDVVDKWGITRQFFSGNGLQFTYGSNTNPAQNSTIMSLSDVTGTPSLSVPNGVISTGRLQSTIERGETGTPAEGAVYKDNVVYAWAEVSSDGTLVDGFGCTVSRRTGSGSYRVTFNRSLPNGASAIVTPKGLNDVVLASVVTNANFADVATKNFNGSAFVFFDSGFYIQVVGRP